MRASDDSDNESASSEGDAGEDLVTLKVNEVDSALAKVHEMRQLESQDVAEAEAGSRAALAEQKLLMAHLEQQERRPSRGTSSRPESISGRTDVSLPASSCFHDEDEDAMSLNSGDEYIVENEPSKLEPSGPPPTPQQNTRQVRSISNGSLAQGDFA